MISEFPQPDADWTKTLTVRAFALAEGQTARTELVDGKGGSLGAVEVTVKAGRYEVTAPKAVVPFTLEVAGARYPVEKTSQTVG